MKEWYVYVNGKCVGTVHETSEELARCAALHKFNIRVNDDLSVSEK